ncbi:hypothetical protein EDB19DRAFT_1825336 [Suillus lakei]|nr:hypothetical protein EDB19DRAFT_1825336 [Suillus lakei]
MADLEENHCSGKLVWRVWIIPSHKLRQIRTSSFFVSNYTRLHVVVVRAPSSAHFQLFCPRIPPSLFFPPLLLFPAASTSSLLQVANSHDINSSSTRSTEQRVEIGTLGSNVIALEDDGHERHIRMIFEEERLPSWIQLLSSIHLLKLFKLGRIFREDVLEADPGSNCSSFSKSFALSLLVLPPSHSWSSVMLSADILSKTRGSIGSVGGLWSTDYLHGPKREFGTESYTKSNLLDFTSWASSRIVLFTVSGHHCQDLSSMIKHPEIPPLKIVTGTSSGGAGSRR